MERGLNEDSEGKLQKYKSESIAPLPSHPKLEVFAASVGGTHGEGLGFFHQRMVLFHQRWFCFINRCMVSFHQRYVFFHQWQDGLFSSMDGSFSSVTPQENPCSSVDGSFSSTHGSFSSMYGSFSSMYGSFSTMLNQNCYFWSVNGVRGASEESEERSPQRRPFYLVPLYCRVPQYAGT